ncbi:MAG TPA: hypothetical protein VFF28_05430 [Candidatus Nanoarchaeia archaeon]|nr:hypothetical protein [Candidatus Nanoarchaeia archaeon]
MRWNGIIFLIGLAIAVIIAIFGAATIPTWAIWVLGILGIIAGLFNIAAEEVTPFLMAAIAFLISFQALAQVLTTVLLGYEAIGTFFGLLNVFVAPATAIVAIVALFRLLRD